MNRLILGKNNSLNVLIIKFFDAVKKKLSKLQAEEFDNLVDGLNKNSDIEDLTTTYLNVKSLLNDIDIQMNTSKIDSALQSRRLIEQPNVVLTADDIICQYTNGTKTYLIYNTSDLIIAKDEDDLSPVKRENISLEELEKTWMSKLNDNCIFISARNKMNVDQLKEIMYAKIKAIHVERYPYNDFLFQKYEE